MSIAADLLAEIDAFIRESEISQTAFGVRALNDGRFVGRLREGSGITVATVDRVRAYIAAERAKVGGKSKRAA